MQLHDHHVILYEITYDRDSLVSWYLSCRDQFAPLINSAKTTGISALQGRPLRQLEPIQSIVDKFAIEPVVVDLMIYPPGLRLWPHIDWPHRVSIMLPLLPERPEPVSFYRLRPGLAIRDQQFAVLRGQITESDCEYHCHYSGQHPTMIDTAQPHGVRNSDQERVFLRIRLYEHSYQEVIARAREGLLFRPAL